MLKLIFWAVIGYVVYRYFQMKAQLKEGQRPPSPQPPPSPASEAGHRTRPASHEGDFIDYEEIK